MLLILTLLLVAGAISVLEFRPETASPPPAQSADPATPDERTAAEEIESKQANLTRAEEISVPTGFINTEGVSLGDSIGKEVVLVEFWAYSCANCKNVQPYLNAWYDKYKDAGLQVIGVHTPEFEFEKDPGNVERAVKKANIEYPIVLDNSKATWAAYNQRYWPAIYLIDTDGFIRYTHFGEGAYDETEKKIQELLSERDPQ